MKIHLFGASGSGVTTTGQAIAEQFNIPYFDSDDYFWVPSTPPYTVKRDPQERNAKLKEKLASCDAWVLGGSVFQWGADLLDNLDLLVFLWIPPEIRMERLKRREFMRYGEVIFKEPSRKKQYEKFLAWAADYDTNSGIANRNLQAHEHWMNSVDYPLLRIMGDKTTTARIQLIMNYFEG